MLALWLFLWNFILKLVGYNQSLRGWLFGGPTPHEGERPHKVLWNPFKMYFFLRKQGYKFRISAKGTLKYGSRTARRVASLWAKIFPVLADEVDVTVYA